MSRNLQVIIVDQDVNGRADLQRIVSFAHFAVVGEAGYGIEAVSLAKEVGPDVVLLSVEEPVARALQTIESLVAALPEVPIIAYSSLSDAGSVRRAMLSGARDYLVTPIRPDELVRSVASVMEQEERRRMRLTGELKAVDRSPGGAVRGTVITVFGAKGGIGKTTISSNLSTALAQWTGQSVVLVDLDTRFGDVAIMMDAPIETTIVDLARDLDHVDRETVRSYLVEHPSGVTILPAPRHPSEWRHIGPEHIERIVSLLASCFDYVVLDTPGTFNEIVATALELGSLVLLVTSMDLASIKDTALALDMLQSWDFQQDKVKLLINHVNAANTIREDDVASALDYDIFWRIPYDPTVCNTTQLGQPMVISKPGSRVSQSLIDLACTISGAKRPKIQKGLLGRLMSR
ncbi:MAG TPA: P-loop NTPase [Dehalococcoidia bacterium]